MKRKIFGFLNSRNSLGNGFLALLVVALIALGCTCSDFGKNKSSSENKSSDNTAPVEKETFEKADASKGEIPTDAEMQEMIKNTLMNFNDALQQKNFSDFHKTISEAWQKQTTPKTFEDGFADFIRKGVDISQIRSQKATISPEPKLKTEEGLERLFVAGTYPTSPKPTQFNLQFIAEGEDWKLFSIEVITSSFK